MLETYSMVFWGGWVILVTIVIQSIVAAVAHRKQSHYVPGKVDKELSHDSFVFRSHRTFQNSLENLPLFLFPAIMAVLVKADPLITGVLVWVYAVARLLHMVLYYVIATEKNPSPRSYFYMIGLLSTLVLYGVVAGNML